MNLGVAGVCAGKATVPIADSTRRAPTRFPDFRVPNGFVAAAPFVNGTVPAFFCTSRLYTRKKLSGHGPLAPSI